jgi:murein tripeptide amidase MpaA
VVPNSNPAGRAAVEAGEFSRRLNAAGVDLNRNFPLGYSNSSTDNTADPGGEEYRGTGPLR